MRTYPSFDHALVDALRLSRAMTAKAALAEMPCGGGKAVILGDPARDKTDALLAAYGRRLHTLEGRPQRVRPGPHDARHLVPVAVRVEHLGRGRGAGARHRGAGRGGRFLRHRGGRGRLGRPLAGLAWRFRASAPSARSSRACWRRAALA